MPVPSVSRRAARAVLYMAYFLGIDGGGTRTTAWLADERGKVLGKAVAGPSNPLKVGFEACEREILRAARQAVAPVCGRRLISRNERHEKISAVTDRRYRIPKFDAVVLGLAGTDRPPVHRKLFAWLRKSIPARKHLLTSDAAIALRAAIGSSLGIIVISGTGSIAYARDARGRVLRSGGWGTLFDDAGSGYDLGRRAIVAALRDYDGRGPRTQLLARVRAALRLEDITQVVLKPLTPQAIAALFPLVLRAAERRDYVARKLCAQAGRDLAELALALVRRLGWSRRIVPVVCAGGVFRSNPAIRRSFSLFLRRGAPRARVMLLHAKPVEGALALARELTQSAAKEHRIAKSRSG
jgi:N-acetylglucosamine kinase-like BadF-type ATPase